MNKFIKWQSYLCGIWTSKTVEKYSVGIYHEWELPLGGTDGDFSFSNGEHSETKLYYRKTKGNAYKVLTTKKLNI